MPVRWPSLKVRVVGGVTVAALVLIVSKPGIAPGQDSRIPPGPAAAAFRPGPIPPNPSPQEPGHRMTFEEVVAMEQTLSNWGRWGPNDERGTLNLVTPSKTLDA